MRDTADGQAYAPLLQHDEAAVPLVRPETYYGDGPFDAPSSEEDPNEKLSPAAADEAFGPTPSLPVRGRRKRQYSLRVLVWTLLALILGAAIIGVLAAQAYTGTGYHIRGAKTIAMDHVFNGTFYPYRQSISWVPEAGDGVYAFNEMNNIKLRDLKNNATKTLLKQGAAKDQEGRSLWPSSWKVSADMKYLLLKVDYVKQWRWSSFGNYYIHEIGTQSTHPLVSPSTPPVISYATWSPTGESIAYVASNDLYVLPSPSSNAPLRITTSGNTSIFNGVPDWVYEEEVFSADFALWWSPDSRRVAFLTLDETEVPTYTYPVYNPTNDASNVVPYTTQIEMKYPKPGYSNPIVSLHVFDLATYQALPTPNNARPTAIELTWSGRRPLNDSIIQEVTWVANSTLLVKEVNRAGDDGNVVVFDLDTLRPSLDDLVQGRISRRLGKQGEEGDEGWIEPAQRVYPLPEKLAPRTGAYLDIVPNSNGFNHIALFSPAAAAEPQWLTDGDWEVTDGIQAIDIDRKLVYFTSTAISSIERHPYSVPLPPVGSVPAKPVETTSLLEHNVPAWYSVNFSPQAGYYVLHYQGPDVPWQKIVPVNDSLEEYPLEDNRRLNDTVKQFQTPLVLYSTIDSDGYELNVKEVRPPGMDETGRTKYPVLFRVYGGPASQLVQQKFERDWHHYLACTRKFVVVVVDGRGTGFKGRKLRNPVKNDLGFWETRDQINAARLWAAKKYVDTERIGIWGWSYGGFMSAKVVEAGAGIHTLAMSVAPVTSWLLYDSIYTERYMDLPIRNPGGYINASITNVTAFHDFDFLLAQGSGDDNVHFSNSAHLIDMFTAEGVRSYDFRMYTDSDHSISTRNGYRELHEFMTAFLEKKWGKGARRRDW